jgi:hypothetical protein
VAISPAVELALRRALVGKVPDFVSAITAEIQGAGVLVSVYHLPVVRNGWSTQFEEDVESEFEQHCSTGKRVPLSFSFRQAAEFEPSGQTLLLHRRH